MKRFARRPHPYAARRRTARSGSTLGCEPLERRALLAVTWPAAAPEHNLFPVVTDEDSARHLVNPGRVYVNQFGDAWLDDLVVGPGGERINVLAHWDDSGTATVTTTGPLQTEMAWYGPGGRLTDARPGSASISRGVNAWEKNVISIAGRDDVAVGKVGLLIDGPDYQGISSITVTGGYDNAYGESIGDVFNDLDYVFYKFTAPWRKVWNFDVLSRDENVKLDVVAFDTLGNPVGGSFRAPIHSGRFSKEMQAEEEVFIRVGVDGRGGRETTARFSISVSDLEILGELWVTTTADSGRGSLRYAIESANVWSDHSTIWIDPRDGATLNLLSNLPRIIHDTTFRFAPGVTSFVIDAQRIPVESTIWNSVLTVSGGRIDTSQAPFTIRNYTGSAVSFWKSANSRIEGLTLVAAQTHPDFTAGILSGAPFVILGFPHSPGAVIRNNTIVGGQVGIFPGQAPDIRVTSNVIRDCKGSGIVVLSSLHGTTITSNTFERTNTGIAAFACEGVLIEGNTFVDNVQSGVYLTGGSQRTGVFGNTFLRNNVGVTLDNAQSALVGGSSPSLGNTITADGDTGLGQFRAGIYGLGDLTGSMVMHTTINTPFLGVNLAQARGLTVSDTIVRNHHGLGLVAQGEGVGMSGTVITGMRVERIGAVPAIDTAGVVLIDATGLRLESSNYSGDTTGIFVFNAAAGLVVVDNVFTGRATGVGLFQARSLVFGQIGRGNTVQNASGAGIYTGGNLAGTAVVGNTISGNAVGIVLDNTTNLTVGGSSDSHGNTISGTGASTGIWARLAGTGTSIRRNRFSGHAANTSLAAATGIDFQP